jgi:hypothetical protein
MTIKKHLIELTEEKLFEILVEDETPNQIILALHKLYKKNSVISKNMIGTFRMETNKL